MSAAPRKAAAWGLVVIALLVAVALGVLVVRRASGAIGAIGRPAEPVITQQVVVQQLREVARLVASEMTLRDVVIYEQERMLSTKRVLLVATGRVSAGIDLQAGGADVRIDSAAKRIRIALQPARVLSIEVLDVKTYDERAGLWNAFTPADRDLIQRRIRVQLDIAARQSGILRHADESAARLLTSLLARDGYTVEITRPLVIQKPAG
ncbi:MAG: hypothetical protein JWL60_239 [Gemmatimonadetes bacterium]|jgi:hypothetical protein|nr:hypothetical protein [Gemmatimonadota bacterium]